VLAREVPTTELLKQDARRRYYDIATGIVWVMRTDDFAVGNFIAVCPWGCLTTEDGSKDYGFTRHTLSADIGFGVVGAFDTADRRTEGVAGFLVGASWNPVDVVRASVGAYVFENQQTLNINASPYLGITLNVLHAATLAGILQQPTLKPPTVVEK
jgi:hypothetical protein